MLRRLVHSIAFAAALAACGPPSSVIPLINSPETPAADGTLVMKPAQNGNRRLAIEVRHLAPPEKVAPTATTYVVWVRPQDGAPQNIGALQVDKDLTGRLDTITPYQTFELFITAEKYKAATLSTGPRVLSGVVSPL